MEGEFVGPSGVVWVRVLPPLVPLLWAQMVVGANGVSLSVIGALFVGA